MKFKFIILLVITLSIFSSCSKQELEPVLEEDNSTLNEVGQEISSGTHTALEAELFDLVNDYRVNVGLNQLTFESTTYYYAGQHNDHMISKNNVSHAKFGERAKGIAEKTGASHVAENVARNYDDMEEVLEAWIASNSHRKSLEGDYTHSAISIKANNEGNLYFTQMFYR
ncbi:CAP domain-containing protein [Maribacter sp. R77961]|uniref:CAP domain-containing protein n=1 Tax=Maribacter sp. R77961 TaxID=3093871 RepID=UPI0037C924D7